MTQVFISYSRKDLEFVERLADDLIAAGLEVWYDLSGLDGGTRWGREIQNAILQSQCFVVVLSPNSIESEWVEKEFMYANSLKRKIIPLLYQPCETPMWFINLHFIDVQGTNYDSHFWVILKAMGVKPGDWVARGKPHSAAVKPEPPPEPALPPPDSAPAKAARPRMFFLRPVWIGGLLGLLALVAFAFWGMPALAARMAPTSTPMPPPTATATNTRTPTQTFTPTLTLEPSLTPTATITIDPTTGTVYGSVAWGTQPMKDVLVTLCTDWLYTCTGTKFSGLSDDKGLFNISGVAPGTYQLITKYPGQKGEDRWSEGGGGGWPASYQVTAGQSVRAGDISICKSDLQIYAPTIKGNTVTFVWKGYPGATSYVGRLSNQPSWETTSTLYTINLQSGSYQLLVEVKMNNFACVQGYLNFTVP